MIEALKQRVNDDAGLVRRGRYLTTSFLLEVGATSWLISIFEGKIVSVTKGPFVMPSSSFALRAPEEEWQSPVEVVMTRTSEIVEHKIGMVGEQTLGIGYAEVNGSACPIGSLIRR